MCAAEPFRKRIIAKPQSEPGQGLLQGYLVAQQGCNHLIFSGFGAKGLAVAPNK